MPSRACDRTAPREDGEELFLPGTVPKKSAPPRVVDIDEASGLLWREGCVGPMVTKAFVDYS